VAYAILGARDFLLDQQHPEGYWAGLLENDTSVTGLYLLFMHYLGEVDPDRSQKAVRHLIRTRNEEGGWVQYPGGPSHLDVTLMNYVALALAGVPEDDPSMKKTRSLVSGLGGLEEASFFTRIMLAFYGLFPTESLPWGSTRLIDHDSLVYRQGFARTIFIPYLVLFEKKAVKDFSDRFSAAVAEWGKGERKGRAERLLEKVMGEVGKIHGRKPSPEHQKKCVEWIAERQEEDGTWAGVFQVTVFSLMALHADDDKRWEQVIKKGMEGVISYQVETEDEVIQQFSVSPVMDTAYAIRALSMAGLGSGSEPIQRGLRWLMDRQVLREGDWKHNNPEGEPGGWSFEFHNNWYPDLDTTSMVLNMTSYLDEADREPFYPEIERGLNWVLSMQNWDGGFAVWDKNNWLVFKVLSSVMDVGDYSHADTSARVLMALANLKGLDRFKDRKDLRSASGSAKRFLLADQEFFRGWYGRFGVCYSYGTGQVLEALGTLGLTTSNPLVRFAVEWLVDVQNPDGGWGESPESYEKDSFVSAPSTAAQTSVAIQGLLTVGAPFRENIEQGIRYLLATQEANGRWEDQAFFATNIPRAWYGRYELLSTSQALMVLCMYQGKSSAGME
jgi:squalene-hopene/tetraprenyl-beta-curcumene cyclase